MSDDRKVESLTRRRYGKDPLARLIADLPPARLGPRDDPPGVLAVNEARERDLALLDEARRSGALVKGARAMRVGHTDEMWGVCDCKETAALLLRLAAASDEGTPNG